MEPIADEEVHQLVVLYLICWGATLPLLHRRVLVDVRSERLLELVFEGVKVRPTAQELKHGRLDARKGEKLFYAHPWFSFTGLQLLVAWLGLGC